MYLTWDDLTKEEKAQAQESYLAVREWEEERGRDDTTSNVDYNYPIDADGVECCKFQRTESGYIIVLI